MVMRKASGPVDISQEFATGCITRVISYQQLPSTNAEAKRLANEGAVSGTVVLAEEQTCGRGRLDRAWESPKGGLYFSVLLRPSSSALLSLLPLATAVAVAETLEDYRIPARIRWPNDVLVENKKAAGILLELESEGDARFVVIGVGVNLNVDLSFLSEPVHSTAVSLSEYCGHGFDTHEVLRVMLQRFSQSVGEVLAGQHLHVLLVWREKSDTLGERVSIETPQGRLEGFAEDIDAQGFLQVRLSNGVLRTVTAGDCLYLR